MTVFKERIAHLRGVMKQHALDAWIVPTADPHLSEYLPEHWQSRLWLSGFTGSAGTLVVCADYAGLWADSRYWTQAQAQLAGSGIRLHKLGEDQDYPQWLADHLPEAARIGVAADMLSQRNAEQLRQVFAAKKQILQCDTDLSHEVWTERPPLPRSEVYPHPPEFCGETAAAKLARVRAAMHEAGADHHLLSSLDDIAWLTNLRGSDVSHNPVFLAHLLINDTQAVLFTDHTRISPAAQQTLQTAGISLAPYHNIGATVAQLHGTLLCDPAKTAVSVLRHLPDSTSVLAQINPSTLFKSCKTPAEITHIRQAMIQDGVALCGFFAELEQKLADKVPLTECDIDTLLIEHRSRQPHYVSPSFDTIAGFNANGALPHYRATAEAHSTIEGDGLLLIDSGAQYLNGTTDITRVVPVGTPTAAHKRDFTLVLKAHIALARAVFPENLPAPLIDSICRLPLWQAQCDYGHGTGHGVGYFLNVHEGPQVIACRTAANPHHALKIGMLTSNEPGLYRPEQWGIRIENLIITQAVAQPQESAFGKFLCFETVTLCPIDTRLIDLALLDDGERAWLNGYHAEVRAKLYEHTTGAARAWLLQRTEAV
ncbi:aminopeptidase P family protein [Conchiformibius steedae DSM 2580]|uniref:Aminopeptidase P family protein n=1 Tax=Conchiformibius steedae DSM 2580 TaxID=1121352 RepID=A0AAE9HY24_9NEIS|nr:aminopeptidase P family protein [Conchiformibius steedae]QMT34511.1 aminopeptidase P family protein [Conchiformibius steedae]URD68595.1 aminopeptidase P family protein [Conchiformibius steedae DSM 2580]